MPLVPAGAPAPPVAPGLEVPVALLADELSFFFASLRTYLLAPAPAEGAVADVSAAATQPTNVTSSADERPACGAALWGSCAATLIAAHANAANVIELSFRFISPPRFGVSKTSRSARETPRPAVSVLLDIQG
jgi:hypothetical protein